MTVAAESYEAKALELAIAMLCGSATFRTLVDAASSDAAKARVIETYGGAPSQNAGRLGKGIATDGTAVDLDVDQYAVVGLIPDSGLSTDAGGVGYYDYEFTIGIRLVMNRSIDTLTAAESARNAWNVTGKISAEMLALVGGANALADCEIQSTGPFMDEDGVHRDRIISELTITARG